MILENELYEKLKEDGCRILCNVGCTEKEDGINYELGAGNVSFTRVRDSYIAEFSFVSVISLKRFIEILKNYDLYSEMDKGQISDTHCLYIEVMPKEEVYIDGYLLFMNPNFWILGLSDFDSNKKIVKIVFDENNKAFVSVPDM